MVTALYGTTPRFVWHDESGKAHIIEQGEGGEQGCPLMPALYALAQRDAIAEASRGLREGERVLSFMGDLYVFTTRYRAAEAFREITGQIERHAGVRTKFGKLKGWCSGGGPPPNGLADIQADARTADKPGR